MHAVDGIDLAVEPGEVVAFLGPNGAGKTTTIDLLLGLSVPDAGRVQVLGAVRSYRSAAMGKTGGGRGRRRFASPRRTGGCSAESRVRDAAAGASAFTERAAGGAARVGP